MYDAFVNYFKENIVECIFEDTTDNNSKGLIDYNTAIRVSHGKLIKAYSGIKAIIYIDNIKSIVVINGVVCVNSRDNKYWFRLLRNYNDYEDDNDGIDIVYRKGR